MEENKNTDQVTEEETKTVKSEQKDSTDNVTSKKEETGKQTQTGTIAKSVDDLAQEIKDIESKFGQIRVIHCFNQGVKLNKLHSVMVPVPGKKKVSIEDVGNKVGMSKSMVSRYKTVGANNEIKKIVEGNNVASLQLLDRLNINKLTELASSKKEGDEFNALLEELANPPKKNTEGSTDKGSKNRFEKVDETMSALEDVILGVKSNERLTQLFEQLQKEINKIRGGSK